MNQLLQYHDYGLLILRLAVAVVFIYHAIPKLKNPQGMAAGLGWKSWQVRFLGLVECVSALTLIVGRFTQIGAILLALVMIGAMYHKMFKWHTGFSAQDKTGWEFDFVLFAANILILLSGAGSFFL